VSGPIRVFIGSSGHNRVEEAVFVRSLLATTDRSLVIDIIDGDAHVLRRVGETGCTPLPATWRGRIAGNTPFSFARFTPPALCGHRGRSIYLETDQLALGDIGDLWDLDLGAHDLAAVPHAASRYPSHFQTEGHMSSVMLFDNGRCRSLDVIDITERIRVGTMEYLDVISLTDAVVDSLDLSIAPLPPCWNDLQVSWPDTRILHFTNSSARPWLHPCLRESDRWVENYLATIDDGHLTDEDLATAARAGAISRRVRTLPRVPRPLRHIVDHPWQAAERATRRSGRVALGMRRRAQSAARGRLGGARSASTQ
jgi:hypothetical protein